MTAILLTVIFSSMRMLDRTIDYAVLGPVHATPTHPQATPLGFARFVQIVAGARVPVYALGGLSSDDLGRAVGHGAHGVALRRFAWPGSSS